MVQQKGKEVVLGMLLIFICILASGCLVVANKSSSYGPKGAMVPGNTLEQIEAGQTSKGKLVALLGEPSIKQEVDESTEIYKYVYTEKTQKCTTVFLLFVGNESNEERQELFFEIENDIVVDWWKGQEDS